MIELAAAVVILAAQATALGVRERNLRRDRQRRAQAARVTVCAAEGIVSNAFRPVLAAERIVAVAYRRIGSEARHPSNDYPLTDG